jgi:hypothetical protein
MEEEEEKKEEKIVKTLLIGRWHPKIDPDLEKVLDRILDLLVYGTIFYLAVDVMMVGQYNEYQSRSYCKIFIDAAKCTCGYDTSILTNRTIALPNPSLLPGDTPPFNPLFNSSKEFNFTK